MKNIPYYGYNTMTVIFLISMSLNIFLSSGYHHFIETVQIIEGHCPITASLYVLTNTRIENIQI